MTTRGSLRSWARPAGPAVLALALALAVGAWGAGPARPAHTATAGWSNATTLSRAPGVIGNGLVVMSCSSPGNCSAGGPSAGEGVETASVVSQVHGVWGKVQVVRGLVSRKGYKAIGLVTAMSCPSAGNCVAVGSYRAKTLHRSAFIVTQRHGAWGKAIAVPGLAALNKENAGLSGVSCPSVGDCAATGFYQTRNKALRIVPFLVNEVHGIWGRPLTAPGIAALPGELPGPGIGIGPISCPTPGNCGAIGTYPVKEGFGNTGGFVISQVHGIWHKAIAVPGLSALNRGRDAELNDISCPAPGNCGAIGTYSESDGSQEAFVVSEASGTWDKAIEIPGTAKLNTDGVAQAGPISCPSAGNCDAGGSIAGGAVSSRDDTHAFVVSQVHGTWDKATEIPGLAKLDRGDQSVVISLSCSSAGNCGAGGFYTSAHHQGSPVLQAFVVNQAHGVWSKPIEVPGTAKLNTAGNAIVTAISCPAANRCSAGGTYTSKSGPQTFATSQP